MKHTFEYKNSILPKDLREAIDILEVFFKKIRPKVDIMSESVFLDHTLLSIGFWLNEVWYLDWNLKTNKHKYIHPDYPITQPKLQEQFIKIGIYDPISMAEVILIILYRRFKGVDLQLTALFEQYKDE